MSEPSKDVAIARTTTKRCTHTTLQMLEANGKGYQFYYQCKNKKCRKLFYIPEAHEMGKMLNEGNTKKVLECLVAERKAEAERQRILDKQLQKEAKKLQERLAEQQKKQAKEPQSTQQKPEEKHA